MQICTDLLYQPLTLLDCLHTFCGACLKEWFAFQASTATSVHPYTCPSCRASVRSTQPNATVTTLLDMFIQANPHRGKSEEEKKADREKFKYGDVVMPKLRRRGGQDEEEDRRLLEEVQQLSLREVGIDTTSNVVNVDHLEPPRERRRRERNEGRRERSSDARRSADGRSRSRNEATTSSRHREVAPPRVIEHQSSLRSLLSASDLDSQEMEEEIMRQIMEEGLLDGIDLNNIDVAQEDEISERIAQAYRRRQEQKRRERRERRERLAREGLANSSGTSTPEIRSPAVRDDEPQRRRAHTRSTSTTPVPRDRDNRPPISRPGLMDVANQGTRTRHTRSSSQGSSRSARENRPAALSVPPTRAHNHSQPDLIGRPVAASTGQRRQSDNDQRSALEGRQQFRNSLQAHTSTNANSPRRSAFHFAAGTESPTSTTPVVTSPPPGDVNPFPPSTSQQTSASSRRTTDPTGIRQPRAPNNGTPPLASPITFPRSTTDPPVGPSRSQEILPATSVAAPALHSEPHITCRSCGKDHIEYDLHYNCSRCDEGTYNLCQPCYRRGKGCKHWYGFGWAAWPAYQQRAPAGGYPPDHEYPHIMRGHRFRRPQAPLTETVTPPHVLQSSDDPAQRLEAGVFCDICTQWANACYWKCDYCNEGEWGYCNDCVNQGRHCTHALLPISHVGKDHVSTPPASTAAATEPPSTPRSNHLAPPYPLDPSPPTTPPLTPRAASLISGPGHVTLANSTYRPLTFTTLCNICTYPIPPSHTRYHCMKCNDGDYDVCSNCYQKLVLSGRISKEDGTHGWRRCLRSHRMIVIGFEDRDGGQRRIVVRNLVGGFSLRDEIEASDAEPAATTDADKWTWRDTDGSRQQFRSPNSANVSKVALSAQRFPPDGGVGLRIQARWSYFPADGVTDELAFPKFAEITEAEDINGDWCWGVYAGSKGLFPGGYGRIIGGNMEREGRI